MATNNFLQWNPAAVGQETDAEYLADSQRAGGATDPSVFDAALANKLFYQLTTGMTALTDMMALKGFSVSDANLGTLTAQLANIMTTADLRGYAGAQSVPYASALVLNAGAYLTWAITLTGNVASVSISTVRAGDIVTIIFTQDSTGGRTVTWPSTFLGAGHLDLRANYTSAISFVCIDGTYFQAVGPMQSSAGIVGTPIGAQIPSTGAFTTLNASSATVTGLSTLATVAVSSQLTAPTVPSSDVSTSVATTAWAKYGLAVSLGSSGYVGLPAWLGGWMIQWGNTGTLPDASSTMPISFGGGGFPTACFGVTATQSNNIGTSIRSIAAVVTSRTGFSIQASGSNSTAFWFAVGN